MIPLLQCDSGHWQGRGAWPQAPGLATWPTGRAQGPKHLGRPKHQEHKVSAETDSSPGTGLYSENQFQQDIKEKTSGLDSNGSHRSSSAIAFTCCNTNYFRWRTLYKYSWVHMYSGHGIWDHRSPNNSKLIWHWQPLSPVILKLFNGWRLGKKYVRQSSDGWDW